MQTNLTNPTTVSDAIQRKAAKINATSSSNTVAAGSSPPKYVDRAAARREALGQPEHPSQDRKRKLGADPSLITTTMAPSVPDQVNKSGIDPLSNVGAKMLEKMVRLFQNFVLFGLSFFFLFLFYLRASNSILMRGLIFFLFRVGLKEGGLEQIRMVE